jgi:hypothetical protein
LPGRIALRDINLGSLQLLPPPYELTGILASEGLMITGNKTQLNSAGKVTVDLFEGHAVASDFRHGKSFISLSPAEKQSEV